MTPSNKFEKKRLQNDESSDARKSHKNSSKKTRKSHELREGNRGNHEFFHTTTGQILYKIMRKI
jgi:hypothetical protein